MVISWALAAETTKGDDLSSPFAQFPKSLRYFFFEVFFAAGFFAAFLAGFFVAMSDSPIEQNLRERARAG